TLFRSDGRGVTNQGAQSDRPAARLVEALAEGRLGSAMLAAAAQAARRDREARAGLDRLKIPVQEAPR
ncbi:MAG: hypothetical protein ACF8R7_04440, partial [Phycisphaerales bacterium JB039]